LFQHTGESQTVGSDLNLIAQHNGAGFDTPTVEEYAIATVQILDNPPVKGIAVAPGMSPRDLNVV